MTTDLRSDTVTKPGPAMLEAMMHAPLGDDVFGEDPTVNRLEEQVARMFGYESALFVASGTMANQIAIKAQTQPMDEIIAHEICHIYYYETGGYAFNSGVSIKLAKGDRGIILAEEVERNIQPDHDWLPRTSLVTLENTCNKGGGSCYSLPVMQDVSNLCRARGLKLHLDGARIFNAVTAMGYTPMQLGGLFDTISMCFSKGMGAPVGSVLAGNAATIRNARRIRKAFGGGMRQAGIIAAACIHALDHHLPLLKEDHRRASILADELEDLPWVSRVQNVETNIVLFDLAEGMDVGRVVSDLAQQGVQMMAFGPMTIRAITHLDISDRLLDHAIGALRRIRE